jgi:hypothetical protein
MQTTNILFELCPDPLREIFWKDNNNYDTLILSFYVLYCSFLLELCITAELNLLIWKGGKYTSQAEGIQ